MRKAFVQSLCEIAEQDERVILLTADLGFMVLEPFRDRFPLRFINVGVCEQNSIALATGLAMEGYIPYVYSIATFISMRGYEFIRNGPVAHNLPIRIIGVGTGVDYAFDGLTHYGIEDLALMRTLPSVSVIAPADDSQTSQALKATWDLSGPIYYRLSKQEGFSVPKLHGDYHYNQMNLLRTGAACILLTHGSISSTVYEAASQLEKKGISCTVVLVSTLQPFDQNQLVFLLSGHRYAFTYEPALPTGGLGTLVAETIATHAVSCKLITNGITHHSGDSLGNQEYLHHRHHIDVESIVEDVQTTLA